MRTSRVVVVLALTVAGWALLATPAQAHALLVTSDPPDGSVLPVAPAAIELWFSEDVSPDLSSARLVDADGRTIPATQVVPDREDPRHLTLELPELATGAYGVLWQVLATNDGHPTAGVIVFSVGAAAPTLTSVPTAASASPLDPALRGLRISLLALIVGGLGMVVLVLDKPREQIDAELARSIASARRRVLMVVSIAAPVAVEVAVIALVVQAHELAGSGSWSDAFARLLLSSRTGALWFAYELLLICIACCALVMWRRTGTPRGHLDGLRSVVVLMVLGLVAIEALGSHAAAADTGTTTALIADALHVLTALLWIGALATLVIVLGPGGRGSVGRSGLIRACRGSFSRMAAASVLLIVVTGLYGAGREVVTVGDLVHTSYGRILLAKVGLLVVVGCIGLINSARLHGRDAPWAGPARRLVAGRAPSRRSIAIEAAFGAVILLAAGLLADTPPALATRTEASPPATATLYGSVQDLLASVSVTPNRAGVNGFTVDVASSQRPPPAPVGGVILMLRRGEGRTIASISLPLQEVQPGRYFGSTSLAQPGSWNLVATITRGGRRLAIPMHWSVAVPQPPVQVARDGRRLAPIADGLAGLLLVLVVTTAAFVTVRRRRAQAASEETQARMPTDAAVEIEQPKEKLPV